MMKTTTKQLFFLLAFISFCFNSTAYAQQDPIPMRKGADKWTYSTPAFAKLVFDDARPFKAITQPKTVKINILDPKTKKPILDPKTKKPRQKDSTYIEEVMTIAAVNKDGKWGYVTKDGKFIVQPKYYIANDFINNYAIVGNQNEDDESIEYGIIDRTGKEVVPPKFDLLNDVKEGIAAVTSLESGKSGFIDVTGKMITNLDYERVRDFNDGMAAVEKGGKWGFINKTGKLVIPTQFENAYDFNEGYAKVYKSLKWGFIDKTGATRIQYLYQDPSNSQGMFMNNLARVQLNNQQGWIDKANNHKIPIKYAEARDFSENLAAVKVGTSWGFINVRNEEVIKPQFEEVGDFKGGLAPFRKGKLWGFINTAGKQVIPPKYDGVEQNFNRGIAYVQKGDKSFYIDSLGKEYFSLK